MQKIFFSILVIMMLSFYSCENQNNDRMDTLTDNSNVILHIYFDKSYGDKVVVEEEAREINKLEYKLMMVMQELIKGPSPSSGLSPILPKNTQVLSISIKDNIAIIDLSKECKIQMEEKKEEACLKSIITSILKIEEIKKVKINIESNPNCTLGGYFDLSNPLDIENIPMAKFISK